MTVAVIGGGLAGLTAAYRLSLHGAAPVVLFERAPSVGGWCRSRTLEDERTGASVTFERGPRSIRPAGVNGLLTLQLASELGLADDVILVPKTAPSATRRLILDPASGKLLQLPSSLVGALAGVLHEPTLRRAFGPAALEPFRAARPYPAASTLGGDDDESVDSFISRRFGPALAADLVSAFVRGVYGADSRSLSAFAAFPSLVRAEKEHGGVVRAALARSMRIRGLSEEADAHEAALERQARASLDGRIARDLPVSSVWNVRGGLERLVRALHARLQDQGVEIRTACDVQRVERRATGGWQLTGARGPLGRATHVVLSSPSLLGPAYSDKVAHSSILATSLAFRRATSRLASAVPEAFGYLIPRSYAANEHSALGTIFDQHVIPRNDASDEAGVVKLTVLRTAPARDEGADESKAKALAMLRLHLLGETAAQDRRRRRDDDDDDDDATMALVDRHENCIAAPAPGHAGLMRTWHDALRGANVTLVSGGAQRAVGVNAAVRAGWDAGENVARVVRGEDETQRTGLEPWLD